jgi:translation elongation factor EF-1alpha
MKRNKKSPAKKGPVKKAKRAKGPVKKKVAGRLQIASKPGPMPKPIRPAYGKPIGAVTHFYRAIKVAIVKFKKPVRVGARIRFKGATTDFTETVKSMQYDHKPISVAPKGKQIGIKVGKRVREGDSVFEDK